MFTCLAELLAGPHPIINEHSLINTVDQLPNECCYNINAVSRLHHTSLRTVQKPVWLYEEHDVCVKFGNN